LKKINNLRSKIRTKREEAGITEPASLTLEHGKPVPRTLTMHPPNRATSLENSEEKSRVPTRKPGAGEGSDYEYNGSMLERENDEDDRFSYKSSTARKTSEKLARKSELRIFADQDDARDEASEPPTPRTRYLLDIVNSRDVAMIRGLSGVGAKKARDLVEFLELQNEAEGGSIQTLQQLEAVPGVGNHTVERAYEGIASVLV
jgi:DNA uptake protein ComE-like DNA-binding protein